MATLAAEVVTPIEQWLGPTLLAGTFAVITALVGLGFNELLYRRQRQQRWEKDLRILAARFVVAARSASDGDFSTISDVFYELELVAPQEVADAGTLLLTQRMSLVDMWRADER